MTDAFRAVRTRGSRVWQYLRSCFQIDSRSLALFRIGLATLILADVLLRSRNFSFYYTDDGVIPQELAEAATPDTAVSVFYYTSDPTVMAVLFALHFLVALQLLVGYRTRLATIVSFLFVISLDHHNPLVLSYADVLFRIMLFWAIFLPLGERWSIDAVHRRGDPRPYFVGVASVLALLQMVFMYSINGLNKSPSELWRTGEAAVLVMGIDEMTFLLGDFMRNFEIPLQVGGWLWFHILLSSPLLILLRGRKRLPLLALFFGGHAAFAITVRIGAFAFVAIVALSLFLPREFWSDLDAVLGRLGVTGTYAATRTALVRVAGSTPRLMLDDDRLRRVRHAVYTFTMAAIVVAIAISLVLVLPDITLLGEEDVEPDQHPEYRIQDSAVGSHIYTVAESLNIDQPEWSIFAGPGPRTTDRYYVFPAETADGERYDIYNERELTYERPGQQLQRQHSTYRERFYMNSVRRSRGGQVATQFVEYLCESWEEEHGTELTHVNIYEITEQITRDTIDDPENRTREANLRSRHSCSDEPSRPIYPPDF